MIELALLVNEQGRGERDIFGENVYQDGDGTSVVANATRPAILTYWSTPVDISRKLLRLPAYVLGWKKEAESVHIQLFQRLRFGSGIISRYVQDVPQPNAVRLKLRSKVGLELYGSRVIFNARLRGLRYFMHNHRITSFLLFTTLFFIIEALFALSVWAFLSVIYTSAQPPRKEQGSLSNNHVKSPKRIKQDKRRQYNAPLVNRGMEHEDDFDDDHDDDDEEDVDVDIDNAETTEDTKDGIRIKQENSPDPVNAFPAFPQRARKYSSASTSASGSGRGTWSQPRSYSGAVKVKKEEDEDGGEEVETWQREDSGIGSSVDSRLDTRRRQDVARRRMT